MILWETGFIGSASLSLQGRFNRKKLNIDGHTACISLEFKGARPDLEVITDIRQYFNSISHELDLLSAPKRPLTVKSDPDRPQPRKDRYLDKAMAVIVGRLKNSRDNHRTEGRSLFKAGLACSMN